MLLTYGTMSSSGSGQEAGPWNARPDPFLALTGKVILLADTDSTTLAHCRTILRVLGEVARELVVVTASTGRMDELEALGPRVIDFDCRAFGTALTQESITIWRLARIIEDEDADVVHFFGLKPAALGSMAVKLIKPRHAVLHLPDLGALDAASGVFGWLHRSLAFKVIGSLAAKPSTFLLAESELDMALLRGSGVDPGPRFALVGGTGIDIDRYPVLPPPQNSMPVAAFIGPLTRAGGVADLMRAFDRVWARGVRLRLELHGEPDPGEPDGIAYASFAQWMQHPGVRMQPPAGDVRELWRRADFFVCVAPMRQGLPRPLLEAAACGRPVIATDMAGGGGFVRDEVEGLVVPASDPTALAEALERLARDAGLRARMGAAARLRVLQGYTDAHISETLRNVYRSLLSAVPGRALNA
jgi:glycosyltransferase involved in cell wall biosynthesis